MRHALALAGMLLISAPVFAQEHGIARGTEDARSPEVLSVASRLACDCGCPHEPISKCRCGTAQKYRLEIAGFLASGLDQQGAYAAMLEKYGNALLAEPPDTGMGVFSKRVLPVILAIVGLGVVGLVIRRLRSRGDPDDAAAEDEISDDDEYLQRVDDELENR